MVYNHICILCNECDPLRVSIQLRAWTMKVGVLSKFKVASLNKQIQAPHQPVPPLAINFTTMRVMMSFQSLNNCRLWQSWLMTIMDPPSTLTRRPIHLGFFGGWENQDRNILREISLRLLSFSTSNTFQPPNGQFQAKAWSCCFWSSSNLNNLCHWGLIRSS